MNKIIIKGRITADPELKKTTSGIPVTSFSVAVNRRRNADETDFVNCEAWRSTAEFVSKYFRKGQEILLSGELHIDKYEKDGEKRTATKVSVDTVEFCGSKTENYSESAKDIGTNADDVADGSPEFMPVDDTDLPF